MEPAVIVRSDSPPGMLAGGFILSVTFFSPLAGIMSLSSESVIHSVAWPAPNMLSSVSAFSLFFIVRVMLVDVPAFRSALVLDGVISMYLPVLLLCYRAAASIISSICCFFIFSASL